MVVEGGGRLWTGGIVDLTDANVAELLDARAILVSPYRNPADLDDVLVASHRLGDSLEGVLFNAVTGAEMDGLTEEALRSERTRSPAAVERTMELLADAVDVDAVLIAEE